MVCVGLLVSKIAYSHAGKVFAAPPQLTVDPTIEWSKSSYATLSAVNYQSLELLLLYTSGAKSHRTIETFSNAPASPRAAKTSPLV